MNGSALQDITPCSPLKANRCFGGTCRLCLQGRRMCQARNQFLLATCFMLVSRLAYTSTLKVEATCCSVTSIASQRATRHYPEDTTHHNPRISQTFFLFHGFGPLVCFDLRNQTFLIYRHVVDIALDRDRCAHPCDLSSV
jgi:hypothetical protein